MNRTAISAAAVLCCTLATPTAPAHELARPDDHAPIGVMGDHFHDAGEWMFSYRFMRMDMAGNRRGTDGVDADTIVTSEPNRFFGNPMQPPTLRVVPTEMTMDMHMLGAMYAPSDRVTLMFMTHYLVNEMDHLTYAGPSGTDVLGGFTTRSEGLGDSSVSALVRLREDGQSRLHATLGVSIPTGSNTETDDILTPMGMRPTVRLPYPMQLGSGTWDPIVGLTWSGFADRSSYGVQWRSTFRLSDNDEGYHLGDEHRLTGWWAWRLAEPVSVSLRLQGYRRGDISGMDPAIMAPVQTADPDRQGIERLSVGAGLNWSLPAGNRLALEFMQPLHQDLDGPQLETDWQLGLGWQWAF
ncbi:MAG: transporter [Gammaproteobacteria bacterium]|jgi:hypothetical protein|nr:transporter [Gammaproteobacteria bacterium]